MNDFDKMAEIVDDFLARLQRETGGDLRYHRSDTPSRVRFTVHTKDDNLGLDITVDAAPPYQPKFDYHNHHASSENGAWRAVGSEMEIALRRELGNPRPTTPQNSLTVDQEVDINGIIYREPTPLAEAIDALFDYYGINLAPPTSIPSTLLRQIASQDTTNASPRSDESTPKPEIDTTAQTQNEQEPIGIRARRLGIRTKRLERFERILAKYIPRGLTQQQMAEKEDVSTEAIRNDFRDMRKHKLLPPVAAKTTP